MVTKRVLLYGALTFAFGPIAPEPAHAQAYPQKLVKIVGPGGAGGRRPNDILARIAAQRRETGP